jgi:hypothetical protein
MISYEVSPNAKRHDIDSQQIPVRMVNTLVEAASISTFGGNVVMLTEATLGGISHYIKVGGYNVPGELPRPNDLVVTRENVDTVMRRISARQSISDLVSAQKAVASDSKPSAP